VVELKRGDWIEFQQADGSFVRMRLNWVSPQRGIYLFTNPGSPRATSIAPDALALQLARGEARIVDAAPMFDRAVSQALGQQRAPQRSKRCASRNGADASSASRLTVMLLVTDVPSGAVLHALETMRFLAVQLAIGQRSIFRMVDFRLLVFEPVSFACRDRSILDTLVDPRLLPVLSLVHPLLHSFRRACLRQAQRQRQR
jgi:hypothetical protein